MGQGRGPRRPRESYTRSMRREARLLAALALLGPGAAGAQGRETLDLRGQEQTLRLFGPREGRPVVLASGDGGFVHLAPEVAEILAGAGCFVVGFDAKHYLSSFTSGARTLRPEDVPRDFRVLVDFARQGRRSSVLLVGVSEGAGLSVLAASDPDLRPALSGVLALGLPDVNELGWRFVDSAIYLTHKVPNEPTFQAGDYLPRLGELPVAAIHSTHDEFVPLDEARRLLALPGGPRRLFVVEAADHRFSDRPAELRQALAQAVAWLEDPRHP